LGNNKVVKIHKKESEVPRTPTVREVRKETAEIQGEFWGRHRKVKETSLQFTSPKCSHGPTVLPYKSI
jgi:hypothetical protein